MHKQHRGLTPKRREAWDAAIAKLARHEDVTLEEHSALLREGMLGDQNKDVAEEAQLFLTYWFRHRRADPIPWLGPAIANSWFSLRDWDRQWTQRGRRRLSEPTLREYIAADDFDHWIALNEIAARLHENRERFPSALAVWSADVHRQICDGTFKPPAKERANRGQPPYAHEDRNRLYDSADNWLEHYGMEKPEDRIHTISDYTGDSDDVVRKGLKRWREQKNRRAPWPGIAANH